MIKLEGPRVGAASGQARSLAILLHGYGADGNDLIGLAEPLAPHLPDTVFRAPDAPERCAVNPMGRQWFPISSIDGAPEAEMRAGAARAVAALHAHIDDAIAEEGLGPERTILLGFSQGTMLALHVGLRRSRPFAGIVGFSGRLWEAEAGDPITSKPPVLLLHGDSDELVPVAALSEAKAGLEAAGVPVQTHVSEGLGHGVGPDGLGLALEFIKSRLS